MNNLEKFIPFKQAFSSLINYAKEQNFENIETIKWIMVKVLRLKREQFDKIARVSETQLDNMKIALKRHINGESLSKIFGFIEFYGNFFNVTENVFDPRLSTETIIDAVLKNYDNKNLNIRAIDLCTGSGCIAITLSKLLKISVDAVDFSPLALEIALENNKNIGANVSFIEMDLNNNWNDYFKTKYDIIVSNPPYWNSSKILSNSEVVKNNPISGFDGGEDGLHFIKLIINNAPNHLTKNGQIFLEIDPDQEDTIKQLLTPNFKDIKTYLDYRKIVRVISAKLK